MTDAKLNERLQSAMVRLCEGKSTAGQAIWVASNCGAVLLRRWIRRRPKQLVRRKETA